MVKGYYLPTKVYFGSGIIKNISEILDCQGRAIGLFADNYFLERGFIEKIKEYLGDFEIRFVRGVKANPLINQVERAAALTRDSKVSLIVGIGGGSTLDTAKSAALLAKNPGVLIDFLQNKKAPINKGIPLVAIPTTSGTGSEVSPYATIWAEDKTKYSLNSPLVFSSWAVCDPELTLTLPTLMTASTGMDALCQAMEAYWSIHSFPLSDVHAVRAIYLVLGNLEKAVRNPSNLIYRENMMLAALEAGKAFSQTATTAVHSVSYPLTAYFNIPHGYACALTLSSFLKYNFEVNKKDCNDKRGAEFVKARILNLIHYLGCQTIDDACSGIRNLMQAIGLETSLSKAGVSDIDLVVKHGFTLNRVANNPRFVSKESLTKILEDID